MEGCWKKWVLGGGPATPRERGAIDCQRVIGSLAAVFKMTVFLFIGSEACGERLDLRPDRLSAVLERELLAKQFLFGRLRLDAVARLLIEPGGAGEHAGGAEIGGYEINPLVRDEKLTDLVGVCHAAGLQDVK